MFHDTNLKDAVDDRVEVVPQRRAVLKCQAFKQLGGPGMVQETYVIRRYNWKAMRAKTKSLVDGPSKNYKEDDLC